MFNSGEPLHLDASDLATGLPPMEHDADAEGCVCSVRRTLLVITGTGGGEGILELPGGHDTVAVKYLHLRGLVRRNPDDPNDVEWAQATLAIPAELVPAVMAVMS